MSISMSDKNIPKDAEAYYETIASQEEIYLEETEEEVRTVLTSEARSRLGNDNPRAAEGLEEGVGHAAEELITGDSDDPPLSEDAVAEMLRKTQNG